MRRDEGDFSIADFKFETDLRFEIEVDVLYAAHRLRFSKRIGKRPTLAHREAKRDHAMARFGRGSVCSRVLTST